MATVYSLVCFGGRSGKTVTFTDAGDVVNLTNHGLRTALGKSVVFSTTGTLPTGLTAGTTYYAREGADANKFTLHTSASGALLNTGQVAFTGTGSGTHTVKGTYFQSLTAGEKARYGTAGSERIYDSLAAFLTARGTASSAFDTEYCELGEAYSDTISSSLNLVMNAAQTIITTRVNGQRSAGFHNGSYAAGYILRKEVFGGAAVVLGSYGITIDGFSLEIFGSGFGVDGVYSTKAGSIASNMFIYRSTYNAAGAGISFDAQICKVLNNVVFGFSTGIKIYSNAAGCLIGNNFITGNYDGFGSNLSATRGYYYNNISIGNLNANWPALTNYEGASNNAGLSTDTVWATGANPKVYLTTSDFVDFANKDLRPALSNSPQVETGTAYFGIPAEDMGGDTRPAYMGGGAAVGDVGPYEFDHGYGDWPNAVTVDGSGIVDGSRVKIAKQSDGTELRNVVLSGTTADSFSQNASSDIPVYVYARKGSAAPFYKPLRISATVTAASGLSYNLSGLQIEDIARASSYPAGVATDWTFDSGTGVIAHASGTTRYSVQDLYSWHQNYYDDSATVDDSPLMDGTTPTIFSLINTGSISDSDLQDLYGGSVAFGDGTLWSNLYTVGSLSGSPDIYLYQGTTKLAAFWGAGHIDVLVKVKNAGMLISLGLVTGYARKWGTTYANYETDLSAGGRNVMPLATLPDAGITADEATVAGWSDVAFTFGTYSLDFGDGDGSKTYYSKIDCAGRPLAEVYQRSMYVTRAGETATLNGVPGERYQSAHASMTPNPSAPFGTYSGGVWTLAPGVWLDNVPSGDLYSFILTDAAGGTHQNVQALFQSVTVSNVLAGSRVQIMDTTNDLELFNDIAAGSTVSWEDDTAPAGDRAIRVRITYVDGTDAKKMIEASIGTCGTAAGNKDVSYLASQENDSVYIANAVDGSTVANITINDADDLVQIAIPGGTVPWKDIYAYQVYWLNTETGIRDDFAFMEAIDQANYVLSGFKIKNTSSPVAPLKITGGYGRDATTGSVEDIFDTTGGSIFPVVDHVVSNVITVSGSSVITGDIADLPTASEMAAAVLSAATSAPIYADIRKVNSTAIAGAGTAESPWGP